MGDLNTSSSYVTNDKKIDLVSKYHQITNNKMDTMVSINSDNAYDRIFCSKCLHP